MSVAESNTDKQDKYDVFLCHNSADKLAVKTIALKLRELGIRPWLDEWALRPGSPWQRVLEEQIENISSVAVFVGESGVGPWQRLELEGFLREFADRGCPLIPVLLPDAPEEPKLPVFLKGMTWVDFRNSEPDPLEQLLWGITGRRLAPEKQKKGGAWGRWEHIQFKRASHFFREHFGIRGQDEASAQCVDEFHHAKLRVRSLIDETADRKPLALFFLGPIGVGKTMICSLLSSAFMASLPPCTKKRGEEPSNLPAFIVIIFMVVHLALIFLLGCRLWILGAL